MRVRKLKQLAVAGVVMGGAFFLGSTIGAPAAWAEDARIDRSKSCGSW